jgi:hypothetical protein
MLRTTPPSIPRLSICRIYFSLAQSVSSPSPLPPPHFCYNPAAAPKAPQAPPGISSLSIDLSSSDPYLSSQSPSSRQPTQVQDAELQSPFKRHRGARCHSGRPVGLLLSSTREKGSRWLLPSLLQGRLAASATSSLLPSFFGQILYSAAHPQHTSYALNLSHLGRQAPADPGCSSKHHSPAPLITSSLPLLQAGMRGGRFARELMQTQGGFPFPETCIIPARNLDSSPYSLTLYSAAIGEDQSEFCFIVTESANPSFFASGQVGACKRQLLENLYQILIAVSECLDPARKTISSLQTPICRPSTFPHTPTYSRCPHACMQAPHVRVTSSA